jgi:hypothetical protein
MTTTLIEVSTSESCTDRLSATKIIALMASTSGEGRRAVRAFGPNGAGKAGVKILLTYATAGTARFTDCRCAIPSRGAA